MSFNEIKMAMQTGKNGVKHYFAANAGDDLTKAEALHGQMDALLKPASAHPWIVLIIGAVLTVTIIGAVVGGPLIFLSLLMFMRMGKMKRAVKHGYAAYLNAHAKRQD